MAKPSNVFGAFLGLMCEPAVGSPIQVQAKYQVIRLIEVTTQALVGKVAKEEKTEEIYSLCKEFNDKVQNLFSEEIEELKEIVLEEMKKNQENKEKENNGNDEERNDEQV